MTGKTVSSIIEPHKELLVDMIPPKKHLLKHQPINTQIALMVWIHDGSCHSFFFPPLFSFLLFFFPLFSISFYPPFCLSFSVFFLCLFQDGYTFCCNLSPRLFSINLSVQEHKVFFQEVRPCTVVFWSHFILFFLCSWLLFAEKAMMQCWLSLLAIKAFRVSYHWRLMDLVTIAQNFIT